MKNTAISSISSSEFYSSLGRKQFSYNKNRAINFNRKDSSSQSYLSGKKGIDHVIKGVIEINCEGYKYYFNPILNLILVNDGGYWRLDVDKYDIHCIAESSNALLDEFVENIDVAWSMYVECDKDELSEDAKELRKVLERDIKKVYGRGD